MKSDVAIIGGAFSGVAVVYYLMREAVAAKQQLKVVVFERDSELGAGSAYATKSPAHILNVPAGRMSLQEDNPSSFVDFLKSQGLNYSADDYVPRHLYQKYLLEQLDSVTKAAAGLVDLVVFKKEIKETEIDSTGTYILTDTAGNKYRSAAVVLAVGNVASKDVAEKYQLSNPYDPAALNAASKAKSVGIIGTGLTAIDTVLALEHLGFKGSYLLASRRAFFPHEHADHRHSSPSPEVKAILLQLRAAKTVRQMLNIFRSGVSSGINWHDLIDGLRPIVGEVWGSLEIAEKQRFLRHLKPYWEIHRHRVPPASIGAVRNLKSSGRLSVVRAKLPALAQNKQLDYIFNCTGLCSDLRISNSTAIQSFIANDLASYDALYIGLRTSASGELLNRKGSTVHNAFTLGSLRRGQLWETTAVRELRAQAQQIAQIVVSRLTSVACNIESNYTATPLVANYVAGIKFN